MSVRAIVLAGALAFGTLLATAASAGEYKLVAVNDELLQAVDTGSLARDGDTVLVWVMVAYAAPQEIRGMTFDYMMTRYEFACGGRQGRLKYSALYSRDGTRVHENDTVLEFSEVEAETLKDAAFQVACMAKPPEPDVRGGTPLTIAASYYRALNKPH